MSLRNVNSIGQGSIAMARRDEIGDLTVDIEKSIRVAQRLELDLVVYILTMAQLEIATLASPELAREKRSAVNS
jgi:hypothetical protein